MFTRRGRRKEDMRRRECKVKGSMNAQAYIDIGLLARIDRSLYAMGQDAEGSMSALIVSALELLEEVLGVNERLKDVGNFDQSIEWMAERGYSMAQLRDKKRGRGLRAAQEELSYQPGSWTMAGEVGKKVTSDIMFKTDVERALREHGRAKSMPAPPIEDNTGVLKGAMPFEASMLQYDEDGCVIMGTGAGREKTEAANAERRARELQEKNERDMIEKFKEEERMKQLKAKAKVEIALETTPAEKVLEAIERTAKASGLGRGEGERRWEEIEEASPSMPKQILSDEERAEMIRQMNRD